MNTTYVKSKADEIDRLAGAISIVDPDNHDAADARTKVSQLRALVSSPSSVETTLLIDANNMVGSDLDSYILQLTNIAANVRRTPKESGGMGMGTKIIIGIVVIVILAGVVVGILYATGYIGKSETMYIEPDPILYRAELLNRLHLTDKIPNRVLPPGGPIPLDLKTVPRYGVVNGPVSDLMDMEKRTSRASEQFVETNSSWNNRIFPRARWVGDMK